MKVPDDRTFVNARTIQLHLAWIARTAHTLQCDKSWEDDPHGAGYLLVQQPGWPWLPQQLLRKTTRRQMLLTAIRALTRNGAG
ncbi:hypothetical protein BH24CHL4_BH24CHL4_07920 [soil metagenome]